MQKRPIIFCLFVSWLLGMRKDNWLLYIMKKSFYGENKLKIKMYNDVVHFIKMAAYLDCILQDRFFI